MAVETVPVIALGWVLLAAAMQDCMALKISNLWPMAVLGLFIAALPLGGVQGVLWQHAVVFAAAFVLGLAAFRFRVLGGGDVKLLIALALWFDFIGALSLLINVLLVGGLVAVVLMIARRLVPRPLAARTGWAVFERRGPIPYGLAIAFGGIFALYSQY